MAKYAYPAIFTKEETGYSVAFPDIEGCFTCGDTLPEAMEMAEDALCLMLYDREEDGDAIPADLATLRLYFDKQSNDQPLTDAYGGFCERLSLI